jgi:hypothetical protein
MQLVSVPKPLVLRIHGVQSKWLRHILLSEQGPLKLRSEPYLYQMTTGNLTSTPILTYTYTHSVNYLCLVTLIQNSHPLGPTPFVRKELGRTAEWIIRRVLFAKFVDQFMGLSFTATDASLAERRIRILPRTDFLLDLCYLPDVWLCIILHYH